VASKIYLYPSLSDEERYGLKVLKKGWSLYYHNSEEELTELKYKPAEIDSSLNCIETDGIWDADNFDLCMSNKIVLNHYRGLFGPAGIACRNAKLGLSVIWSSADSRQRGSIKCGEFGVCDSDYNTEADTTSVEMQIDVDFLPAKIRGDVELSTVIYIAEPGTPDKSEKHLANEAGLILGETDSFVLRLDGTGTLFPVFEVFDTDRPLWYVDCDWLDPLSDSFEQSVSININKAHKNYRYIDQTQKSFCKQLLIEVMSAAVCCIVEEARNSAYWDQITGDETQEHGSVAEAIRYFQDALGWDLSSPLTLSESARSFFDRRMAD